MRTREPRGESMKVRRLVVAAAVLCTCVLVVAGCGSADTAVTANTTITAATTETARLYPVMVGGKWAFIDNTGAIKIEPRFDNVRTPRRYGTADVFSEGLAAVAVGENDDEKWCYIDTSGAMVIEPRFDYAGSFSEGLAAVGHRTGMDGDLYMEFGYINTSGTLVIPIERNTASSFSEGLAMFTVMDVGYPSYFLDKTGATVLGPFDFALDFCEGLAYVEWGDRCGYIDKTGARVIELPEGFGRCQHVSCCFSEGLALVAFSDGEVERHVFVDTSGVAVIATQFDYAQDFSEGLAAAAVQEGATSSGATSARPAPRSSNRSSTWPASSPRVWPPPCSLRTMFQPTVTSTRPAPW